MLTNEINFFSYYCCLFITTAITKPVFSLKLVGAKPDDMQQLMNNPSYSSSFELFVVGIMQEDVYTGWANKMLPLFESLLFPKWQIFFILKNTNNKTLNSHTNGSKTIYCEGESKDRGSIF